MCDKGKFAYAYHTPRHLYTTAQRVGILSRACAGQSVPELRHRHVTSHMLAGRRSHICSTKISSKEGSAERSSALFSYRKKKFLHLVISSSSGEAIVDCQWIRAHSECQMVRFACLSRIDDFFCFFGSFAEQQRRNPTNIIIAQLWMIFLSGGTIVRAVFCPIFISKNSNGRTASQPAKW